MAIRPIRSEGDYDAALQRIETLWGALPETEEGSELDVLATLVEAYEREHYPVDLPDPIEAIRFRLDQMGKDYRALIGVIGARTRVYEVMRGDRRLSLNMIRNLHSKLEIPAEILIQAAGTHRSKRSSRRIASTKSRPRRATSP
jgi:HTH-type transcriptional regulator/antitoxin HigA